MSSVNKVILIGNVGKDPQVRYLDRGAAIANFSLATTERGYTMQNGNQIPDRTEWHSIVLWRNLAEWAEKYIRKGMKIYVEGKLQTRTIEREGARFQRTEVVAENIQVLYRPQELMGQRQAEQAVEDNIESQETQNAIPENLEEPKQSTDNANPFDKIDSDFIF